MFHNDFFYNLQIELKVDFYDTFFPPLMYVFIVVIS